MLRRRSSYLAFSSFALLCASSLLLAAGCGSESDPAPVAPGDAPVVHDPAPSDEPGVRLDGPVHPSEPGAPLAPVENAQVPFEAVFVKLPQALCTSQGMTSIRVTLPKGEYQYANCTLRLIPTSLATGALRITVQPNEADVAFDAPWTAVATPATDSLGGLDVTLHQQRLIQDWSTAKIRVRFDFTDSEGRARFTYLPLSPAAAKEILVYQAPRLTVDPSYNVTTGGVNEVHAWKTRRDAAGHAVFRTSDPISFDAPFTLGGPNVYADWIMSSLRVTPDLPALSDGCVFGDLADQTTGPRTAYGMPRVSWDHGEAGFHLSMTNPSRYDCNTHAPLASPYLVTGSLLFDPLMGGATIAGRYEYRFALDTLEHDLAISGDKDAAGAPVLVATNVADYSINALSVNMTVHCEGGADTDAVSFIEAVPAAEVHGNVTVNSLIAKGESARFPASVLRDGIAKSNATAFAACTSGRWRIKSLRVLEQSEGSNHAFGTFDVSPQFVITR